MRFLTLILALSLLASAADGIAGPEPIREAKAAEQSCSAAAFQKRTISEANLKNGRRALEHGLWRKAIKDFRAGITLLGDEYHDDRVVDDTDQRLLLAGIEEQQGRLDVASNLLASVLAARLLIFSFDARACETKEENGFDGR